MSLSAVPPGPLLARQAWDLALGAIRAMPNLFGGTFVLLLAFGLAFRLQHPPVEGLPGARDLLFNFGSDIATDIITAGAMGAVHRSILLGEGADRPFWRLPPGYDWFLGWLLLLDLPMLAVNAGIVLAGQVYPSPLMLLGVALLAAGTALTVRLSLVLPLAAMEAPGAGWRMAWAASRGKGWRLFGVVLLTFVPLELAALLVGGLFRDAGGLSAVLLDALGGAGQGLATAAVGAALWSRLLQAYGGALARPPVWR